jgi:hypothetical protein
VCVCVTPWCAHPSAERRNVPVGRAAVSLREKQRERRVCVTAWCTQSTKVSVCVCDTLVRDHTHRGARRAPGFSGGPGGSRGTCRRTYEIKSCFSIAVISTKGRRIPASGSTNQGTEKGDLVGRALACSGGPGGCRGTCRRTPWSSSRSRRSLVFFPCQCILLFYHRGTSLIRNSPHPLGPP